MAKKPEIKAMTATSVDVLNAIRNSASNNYRDYVPYATPDAESIKGIGNIIMQYPALQNEFLSALVNRIGLVIITSRMYSNPWTMFKKGIMELGDSVEEIFVNIAKPFQYDPAVAEDTVFKRQIPDVRAAFHIRNYQKYYKATVSQDQLRTAFLSWDGITDLIARIVDSMYTGANYDEFITMKYLLARHILDGHLYPVQIGAATAENAKSIVSTVKQTSNNLEFLSADYNIAGVMNTSTKERQYIIVNAAFDAIMDVEVLAAAFNMSKAEFMGHRVLVDGFGKLDTARLQELFDGDPNYVEIGEDDLTALNAVPAVLVDRDFFMIFDNFQNFTEQYNGEGLYWNYWYHVWKTFSVSPFAPAMVFAPTAPGITSVRVTPGAATIAKGGQLQLTANVVTTGFAPMSVTWSISGNTSNKSNISSTGMLTVGDDETTNITVKATSTYDHEKSGTATITVPQA